MQIVGFSTRRLIYNEAMKQKERPIANLGLYFPIYSISHDVAHYDSFTNEPSLEKTNTLHRRKQRRRSASQ